jgi:hypothetical protein
MTNRYDWRFLNTSICRKSLLFKEKLARMDSNHE